MALLALILKALAQVFSCEFCEILPLGDCFLLFRATYFENQWQLELQLANLTSSRKDEA